jgi:hypothetical protein
LDCDGRPSAAAAFADRQGFAFNTLGADLAVRGIWECGRDIDICAIPLLDDLCLDADLGTIRLKLWKCFVSEVEKVSFAIVNARW